MRKERFAKQKKLSIIDEDATLSNKNADIYDWACLSYDQKKQWAAKMEVFAAMVERMHQGIGKVLAKLKETGANQNRC